MLTLATSSEVRLLPNDKAEFTKDVMQAARLRTSATRWTSLAMLDAAFGARELTLLTPLQTAQ